MPYALAPGPSGENMIDRINLVPQKPLAEKVKSALPLVLGVLLGLVLALSFLEYRYVTYQYHKLDKDIAELQNQKGLADKFQSQVQGLTAEIKQLRDKQQQLDKLAASLDFDKHKKKSFSRALSTISEYLPDSIKCTKINFDNNIGMISGTAAKYTDLPGLVKSLKDDPFFKDAVLKDVDKISNASWDQFSFNIRLELS